MGDAVLDDCTRAIMGWAISLQPNSAEVLSALRGAVLVDSERGPFGGLPGRLRWDHGLEFAAHAVEQAALALGVDVGCPVPTTRWARSMPGICRKFEVGCCTLPEAMARLGVHLARLEFKAG